MHLAEFGMLMAIIGTLMHHEIVTYTWILTGLAIGSVVGLAMGFWVPMTAMPQRTALSHAFGAFAAALVGISEYLQTRRPPRTNHDGRARLRSDARRTDDHRKPARLCKTAGSRARHADDLQGPEHFQHGPAGGDGRNLYLSDRRARFDAAVLHDGRAGVRLWTVAGDADRIGGHAGRDVAAEFLRRTRFGGDRLRAVKQSSDHRRHARRFFRFHTFDSDVPRDESFDHERVVRRVRQCGDSRSAAVSNRASMREVGLEDIATQLAYANKVVFVPGYGLATAQAQHAVRELADVLEKRGVTVKYGIHPVAGRMPGHMNVLLAEANVPYSSLYELEQINPEFPTTDVAVVIGANDVVNPDARDNPGSPIAGMPILEVDRSKSVVVLKRGQGKGFSGLENPLFFKPVTGMLYGDAKDTLTRLVQAVQHA